MESGHAYTWVGGGGGGGGGGGEFTVLHVVAYL